MYLGPRLRKILSRLGIAASFDELCEGLSAGARLAGFEYVALVQHGGLPRVVQGMLVITNYPLDFVNSYIEQYQFVFDPVYDVVEQLDRPFTWEEIPDFVDMTDKQFSLFDEARSYGIIHGVTVPLHIPGEPSASCTFASSKPVTVTPNLTTALHVIAALGFVAALNLHRPGHNSSKTKLTRREAECTTLVALGKSDWEIGEILGLGASTVKYFVSAAKQRYGVYKRSELVARALMDAQILNRVNVANAKEGMDRDLEAGN